MYMKLTKQLSTYPLLLMIDKYATIKKMQTTFFKEKSGKQKNVAIIIPLKQYILTFDLALK